MKKQPCLNKSVIVKQKLIHDLTHSISHYTGLFEMIVGV